MIQDQADALVRRGGESWAYIYVFLGFIVTIESTIVGMMTPIVFPWNILTFAVLAASTTWLFVGSGWFQNKLIGLKNGYEGKAR